VTDVSLTPFEKQVAKVVRAIPKGKTLSYAGVALRANRPEGSRSVVRALRNLRDIPWWRVIRSDGTMAEQVAAEQSKRLRREGLQITGRRVKAP
jgi:methylated-DNA-protein-cysteine methyltransferase-like protein